MVIISRLRKQSRVRLDALYRDGGSAAAAAFVQHCLALLRKGYDLHQYFHPAEEAFGPFAEQGIAALERTQAGHIYLAVDPSMKPGVHKIGLTRKAPAERMRSLGTSGTLGKFHLIKSWPSIEVAVSEANCKQALARRHISGEFYLGSYAEISDDMDVVFAQEAKALQELRALLMI